MSVHEGFAAFLIGVDPDVRLFVLPYGETRLLTYKCRPMTQ
jgi:hypothetical protein